MSDKIYKKIKKQNGEGFARILRNFHNGLLDIPDIDIMVKHAGRHSEDAQEILPYLMTLLTTNDNEAEIECQQSRNPQDPFKLLDEAGYDAFHADTLSKQNSIKKYFQKGELLCTFRDSARYKNYHIVHAVKQDVDEIKRSDFEGKEKRQDTYGTSVISIQMLKSGGFISIKNRYNHRVPGCDNTFNSNPDNIIKGLSASLKHHFNVSFKAPKSSLPDGFVLVKGQVIKHHSEHNNTYYGDNVWVRDGVVNAIDKSAGDGLFDHYLFDNKTKTLRKIDTQNNDSFVDDFNKYYGGNKGLQMKGGNLTLNGEILIKAKASRIKELFLHEFETMGAHCLYNAGALTHLHASNLSSMEAGCLIFAEDLKDVKMPVLKKTGKHCFEHAPLRTQFNVMKQKTVMTPAKALVKRSRKQLHL